MPVTSSFAVNAHRQETLYTGCLFHGLFWECLLLDIFDGSMNWFLLFLNGVFGQFKIACAILSSSCVGWKTTSLRQGKSSILDSVAPSSSRLLSLLGPHRFCNAWKIDSSSPSSCQLPGNRLLWVTTLYHPCQVRRSRGSRHRRQAHNNALL